MNTLARPLSSADVAESRRTYQKALDESARRPSRGEINRLTAVLTEHVQVLRPHLEAAAGDLRRPKLNDALHDASRLLADGPEEAFNGEWTHMRALARTVRVLSENCRYIHGDRRDRGLSR